MPTETKPTILVVDDDPVMQRLVQFALSRLGCEVAVVSSGAAAVEFAGKFRVDLVVVDLMMTPMDGFETARALRAAVTVEKLPIIMLTASGQSKSRDTAEQLGISCFLNKPFSPTELAARAKELLP